MSLKNILCVAAMAALTASPVLAQQPTLRVEDGGLGSSGRIWNFYVTPDGTDNSIAVELGLNATAGSNTSIASATSTADWEDDGVAPVGNPGDNPFTGTVTDGISIAADTVFAALGSTNLLSAETLVLSVEINDPIAVLELGSIAPSIIAEDGTNYEYSDTYGVFGDFDLDGDVDIVDFGDFGQGFEDGTFDIVDFGDFGQNFGLSIANNALTAGASSVPEPASLCLLGLGVAGVVTRRRR